MYWKLEVIGMISQLVFWEVGRSLYWTVNVSAVLRVSWCKCSGRSWRRW